MLKQHHVRNKAYEIYSEEDYQIPVKLSVGEFDEKLPEDVKNALTDFFYRI